MTLGLALKVSTSRSARLLRRSSPNFIASNPVAAQPLVSFNFFLDGSVQDAMYSETGSGWPERMRVGSLIAFASAARQSSCVLDQRWIATACGLAMTGPTQDAQVTKSVVSQ